MTDASHPLQHAFHDADAARKLCGSHVRYQQQHYLVADVLWDEGMMILHATDRDEVQNDSFGRPSRVVPSEIRILLRNSDGTPASTWQEMEVVNN